MIEYFDFSGKVVLVVGAGGIGLAQAIGFAERGADVIFADSNTEISENASRKVLDLGRKSISITVDVALESSVNKMVENILKEFSCIDILINSAGKTYRRPNSLDFPLDEWQTVFDVNTRGTWLCCQAIGREMIKKQGGRIINMSSIAASYGAPAGGVAYGPSKAAVNGLTKTLALEWARYNILVNAIAPTLIETEFTKEMLEKPEIADRLKNRIPLGRWGKPDDIVGLTLFLASNASNFITGQVIAVDGGVSTQLY